MARAVATKYSDSLPEPSFAAKIRDARYLVRNNHFVVTFDSGKEYSFPRSALDIDDGSEVASVRVDRKRFFFHVTQTSGKRYEVPWDRVLHEAEPSYPFFRGRATRAKKAQEIGTTIRKMRIEKGITQQALARAAGMIRANLSRIEASKHRPTLETIERIATALKVSVADLIAAR
ncbi:MAG: helix-turn-helix domain-containing protein [Candidatus Binatia bacterium]